MAKTLAPASVSIVESRPTSLKPANGRVNDVSISFRILKQEPERGQGLVGCRSAAADDDDIRIVPAEQYKEAAACLAEAFAEDDVARYFIDVPDREHWSAEEKWNLHVEILEYVTYAHCLKGLVTTVGDYGAVALW